MNDIRPVEKPNPSTRAFTLCCLSIVVLGIILSFLSFRVGHEWGDDFALYIAQAESIVHCSVAKLKAQQAITQTLSSEKPGPDFYPWGFPLLLSPVPLVFGDDLHAMKVYVYLFYLGALMVMYYLFKAQLSRNHLFLMMAVFATNPYFFVFKDNVLSDVPYLFFFLLLVKAIERFVIEKRFLWSAAYSYFSLGVLVFWSYFLRTQGIVLLILLLIAQVVEYIRGGRRSFRETLLSVIPTAVFLVLFLCVQCIIPASSYPDTFSWQEVGMILWHNVQYYSTALSEFFYYPIFAEKVHGIDIVMKTAYVCTVPVFLWGLWGTFRKDYLYGMVILLSFAILLPLAFSNGLRYLFPAIPFYFYFFIVGLTSLQTKLKEKIPSLQQLNLVYTILLPFLLYSVLCISYLTVLFRTSLKTMQGPYEATTEQLQHFIVANTSSDELLVFHKPRIMRLLTGRNCILQNRFSSIRLLHHALLLIDLRTEDPNQIGKGQVDSIVQAHIYPVIFQNDRYVAFGLDGTQ